jgi:hypothetical protein
LSRHYEAPVALGPEHVLEGFECRSAEQTSWLRRYARQSAGAGTTRVSVVTETCHTGVVAYYAWCMAHIAIEAASPRARKGAGVCPQSVALLARLGVDNRHEGQGLEVRPFSKMCSPGCSSCPTGSSAAVCWSTPRLHKPGSSTCTSYLNSNL